MSVKNLATLDRDICQPLGRILQEAFADGFIGTGTIRISNTVSADPGGGLANGQFQYAVNVTAVLVNSVVCAGEFRLNFAAGCAIGKPGYVNSVLRCRIDEVGSGQPDLSGGDVAGISFEYFLDDTGGAPRDKFVLDVMAGASKWEGLLRIGNHGDCGESVHSATANKVVGFDSDSIVKKIPVKIAGAGAPYYILVGEAMAEVTPN